MTSIEKNYGQTVVSNETLKKTRTYWKKERGCCNFWIHNEKRRFREYNTHIVY